MANGYVEALRDCGWRGVDGLLDEDWNGLLDETVKIPMHGISDSMNVNIAASIFLYEALHCRRG